MKLKLVSLWQERRWNVSTLKRCCPPQCLLLLDTTTKMFKQKLIQNNLSAIFRLAKPALFRYPYTFPQLLSHLWREKQIRKGLPNFIPWEDKYNYPYPNVKIILTLFNLLGKSLTPSPRVRVKGCYVWTPYYINLSYLCNEASTACRSLWICYLICGFCLAPRFFHQNDCGRQNASI